MDNMKMVARHVQAISTALDRVAKDEGMTSRELCLAAAGVAIFGLEDMGCAEGLDSLHELLLAARADVTRG